MRAKRARFLDESAQLARRTGRSSARSLQSDLPWRSRERTARGGGESTRAPGGIRQR